MYLRTVKVPSSSGKINEYVRIVEAYRENGKAKQRVVADLGRKDLLAALLPKLQRLLQGENAIVDEDPASDVKVLEAATWGPMLVVQHLAQQLGLPAMFQELLKRGHVEDEDETRAAPPAERALVLIANRLIRPGSEHALAGWLESDWVCDTAGRRFVPVWKHKGRVKVEHRQLDRWYRTLDRLAKAKDRIEVDLYSRLRDLFSLKVDLVLYDITSSYFEGGGPAGLAFHGHSRDEKPHNVQVVVGVVMAGGWPIAHHVFAGNTVDVTTVQQVVKDLHTRFGLGRVVFVGDRGMVSRANLKEMTGQGQGYLVGLKRRCNPQVDGWLRKIQESAWVVCPGGINTRERAEPLRTRVQEIDSGEEMRVFVIDSDERRGYEQGQRSKCMERTKEKLEALKKRVDTGKLSDAEQIGASAQRALSAHHGQRYYAWRLENGKFEFLEDTEKLDAEKRLEGKYVIGTSEKNFGLLEAVAAYKQLGEVERGFRSMKDVIAMRPIWHHSATRVKGHILVAALALLLERLLEKRLKDAGVDNISAREAMLAVQTIRHVRFEVAGRERCGVTVGSAQARRVLAALGLSDLRPPTPPENEKAVV